jgi:hypothetical protein
LRAQGKLIELELDADNCTSCPCGQVLKIRKKNRVGAAYAKKFKVLKKEHEWILDFTVGTNYRDEWFLKKEYRRYFLDKLEDTRGIKMGIDPFNARFSELVGINLIEKSPEEKDNPLHTTGPPKYKINWEEYQAFRKRGGLHF